jgi:tetratricopeptide (TPR) repeat protein
MEFKLRDLFKTKTGENDHAAAKLIKSSHMRIVEAQELIQQGRLQEALLMIDEFLAEERSHAEAWYKRGNVLKDLGRQEEAAESYNQAIELRPKYSAALCNRGVVLLRLERTSEALESFGQAVDADPSDTIAHFNYALVHEALGQGDAALEGYGKTIELAPEHADAHFNRGRLYEAQGRWSEALADYDRMLEIRSDHAPTHFNRGNVLKEFKRWHDALASYDRAITVDPNNTLALVHRGNVFVQLKEWDAALANYDRAIDLQPEAADFHFNRAVVLEQLKRWGEARASLNLALKIDPAHASAYAHRGNVFSELQQLDSALRDQDQAVALRPDRAEFHFNRAVVLERLGRWEDAANGYRRAVALDCNYAGAYSNLGGALMMLRDIPAAITSYERAIAADPELAMAHYNRAFVKLLSGELLDGFANYEWRWKTGDPAFREIGGDAAVPIWRGEQPLAARGVLVLTEQGLGDTLQFCRYISLLADRGARVTLEADHALVALLKGVDGVADVVSDARGLQIFDFKCSLLSLPLAFKTTLDSIPALERYIQVDEQNVSRWRLRLGPGSRSRIGIVWSGNPKMQPYDRYRSMPLSKLLEYLPLDYEYFCLQKEIRENDRALLAASKHIKDYSVDFLDTAALCECMDLIISVDTSLVHLAGALGRPTWVLLPFVPDWRWFLEGEDSPWYPSAKLYRQTAIGDWDPVLIRVAQDLRNRFSSSG